MSVGATRKIESSVSSASKAERAVRSAGHRSQTVEDIDTTNNVLVRDDSEFSGQNNQNSFQQNNKQPDFKNSTIDISSIETLAINGSLQEETENSEFNKSKKQINIYNNNQSILKDEEVERAGRNYLKHLYEKNEYPTDIDEFV